MVCFRPSAPLRKPPLSAVFLFLKINFHSDFKAQIPSYEYQILSIWSQNGKLIILQGLFFNKLYFDFILSCFPNNIRYKAYLSISCKNYRLRFPNKTRHSSSPIELTNLSIVSRINTLSWDVVTIVSTFLD